MNIRGVIAAVLALPLLTACGDSTSRVELPTFDEPELSQGRSTWMQVCRNCHLTGVAGAPAVSDAEAWQDRLGKGRQALYRNAINGIPTAGGWSMPPRGGMDRLSDDDVRRAVDYMLAAQAAIAGREQR